MGYYGDRIKGSNAEKFINRGAFLTLAVSLGFGLYLYNQKWVFSLYRLMTDPDGPMGRRPERDEYLARKQLSYFSEVVDTRCDRKERLVKALEPFHMSTMKQGQLETLIRNRPPVVVVRDTPRELTEQEKAEAAIPLAFFGPTLPKPAEQLEAEARAKIAAAKSN